VDRNMAIICDALATFGIPAEKSGRNDITVHGKKVSGSAFKKTAKKSFHHGTILIDVERDAFSKYLNPNKAKLLSKGVDSVQSRVLNLKELVPTLNHQRVCEAIVHQFLKVYNQPPHTLIETLDTKTLEQIPQLQEFYTQLNDWNWRFGNTPNFEHNLETRFAWGIIDIHIHATNAIIESVKIYSDALVPSLIEALMENLVGVPYSPEGIRFGCAKVKALEAYAGDPNLLAYITQFEDWLCSQL